MSSNQLLSIACAALALIAIYSAVRLGTRVMWGSAEYPSMHGPRK